MSKKPTKRSKPSRPTSVKKPTGAASPTLAEQDALVALFTAGRLAEGEALARQLTQRYPSAAFSWKALGTLLLAGDRQQDALPVLQRAVELSPRDSETINSLGKTLQDLGRVDEALDLFTRALAIRPDYSSAHANRGNVLAQLGRPEEGLACLDRALLFKPDSAIANNDRGNVLKALSRPEEALAAYRRALALKPEFAQAYNNLGSVLRDLGQFEEALEHYRRALELKPDFVMAKSNYAHCVKRLHFPRDDSVVRRMLIRALREAWCHPGQLMAVCGAFVKMNPLIAEGIRRLESTSGTGHGSGTGYSPRPERLLPPTLHVDRNAAENVPDGANAPSGLEGAGYLPHPERLSGSGTGYSPRPERLLSPTLRVDRNAAENVPDGANAPSGLGIWPIEPAWPIPADIETLVDDELLMCLLETTPVCDAHLEPLLTRIRHSMLEDIALNATDEPPGTARRLRLFGALATQCYLNEYVFAVTAIESARVAALQERLTSALQRQVPIAARQLIALAAYLPLDSLPGTETLLERRWPEPVMAVLIQQVREPLEQAEYRRRMPRLTEIDDGISTLVRNQYEENPYPRWAKAGLVPPAPTIDAYVRQQFPGVPYRPSRNGMEIAILVAGCGTGLHSLDTARRYPGAQVLAIDISLNSLAYAQRKTVELGITNIRYAQADILRLDALAAGRGMHLVPHVCPPPVVGTRRQNVPNGANAPSGIAGLDALAAGRGMHPVPHVCPPPVVGTRRQNVPNGANAPAGIAGLDALDAQFDLIESVGVLHHLADPVAGWRSLLARLRPGGCMSLGFYSERARRPVVMARDLIARQGYRATAADIRRFRQEILILGDAPDYRQLTQGGDFYTLSGCRDLLFHVHEHRFTLPRLAELLRELELSFLGFILDHSVMTDYRQRFPDDPSATNLEHWHQFELENPRTFAGMYQFWVQSG